ncbi:MBL fold metallo-hydrolase [Allonocardiopsis opalescens]|uniref:Cyclase n=1 Tax=Allonocardiopsis opalescens TaxID=1144618 RepID=A0A2T0Q5Q4_9ACTN|nr:MBL fold metallo-hydrolase [Allonocardiopsis opalescens]PRX99100.1 cyclase [Allonocardiopsis opalescens]
MSAEAGTAAPRVAARLEEVADGVFAYTQLPGGWCVSNAGVVVGSQGALVVDTLATEPRALALREAVDRRWPGLARTIVNTHHHGDHNYGNHVFGPGTPILAHERAPEEMAEAGLALTALWPEVEWGDVRVTLPTVTFAERARVHVGGRAVELLYVGPAHTTNDVVAWLPEERVLFAGDVLMSGCAPFNLMGSVAGALTAVDRLRALQPRTIVCGHGPVAGPEVLDDAADYLEWVQWLALEGRARGMGPLEMAREAGREKFEHLIDSERIVGNLHRAYAELDGGPLGRPLDVMAVYGEMVAYNGGRMPQCLA